MSRRLFGFHLAMITAHASNIRMIPGFHRDAISFPDVHLLGSDARLPSSDQTHGVKLRGAGGSRTLNGCSSGRSNADSQNSMPRSPDHHAE